MQTTVKVVLIAATAIVGVRAAWLWFRSTTVPLDPGWNGIDTIEPVDIGQSNQAWIVAQFEQSDKVSRLNRHAAWYAIAAAVLGAISALVCL